LEEQTSSKSVLARTSIEAKAQICSWYQQSHTH